MTEQDSGKSAGDQGANWLPQGIAIGVGAGTLFGVAMNNIGVGVPIGIGLGVAIGSVLGAAKKRNGDA